MTPSLTDKTSTPIKVLRRHTDPPSLWIAVVIGSVTLHLLVFWLIRSYQSSLLWRKPSQASIPIEFVEIASPTKSKPTAPVKPPASKPKTVSSKPSSTNQKLQPKNLPKPVVTPDITKKPNPTAEDKNVVAFAEQRQRELAAQQQRELNEQRQRVLAAQQQRELNEQRQRELAAQQQRELNEQRQRELAAQQQRELAEQQQRELAAQQQRELAEQQQRENAGNTNNQESPSQPSDTAGGSLIASLVGEPQQGDRDRHTNPAKIKPSNQPISKGLEYVKYIEKNSGQPIEFTVILTISEKGKLEHVAIADEAIPAKERNYYEDFVANQVVNDWEFEPAYDNDPNDPKPSNLIVRIRIQPLP
jgi:colicin import membrane protein